MKQRVAVARTLANSPDIMLMDEPFAAIDAQTRLNLQEELIRIWSTQSVTVVFVTHSVEEAVFLADRVVVLSSGPGRVISDLAVPISRDNRKWSDINNNLDFLRIKEKIYGLIRQTSKVE
jgi:NitT/TauT family transport system ATP-binding protein